eukprot:3652639-Heterocapsa_arctica.AAC.1
MQIAAIRAGGFVQNSATALAAASGAERFELQCTSRWSDGRWQQRPDEPEWRTCSCLAQVTAI